MDMKPVSSSNISSVGYDADEQKLAVEFNSGRTYEYLNVPEEEYQNLINASSAGRYFNDNIKNYYPAV